MRHINPSPVIFSSLSSSSPPPAAAAALSMLTGAQMNSIAMEGTRRSHLSTLTKTQIWRMRKNDLQMECSFRGLPTKGDRSNLISRLMKTLDTDGENDDEVLPKTVESNLKNLDPAETYVLRVKGHTTPNSHGGGVGLVLYHSVTNEELWSGRIYCSGDRAGFEVEYSAIILGLEFCKACGIQNLVLQSTNDTIVFQINGVFKVQKTSLKPLIARVKTLQQEGFDSVTMATLSRTENEVAAELATKALATRKSINTPKFWKFQDPMGLVPDDSDDISLSDDDASSETNDEPQGAVIDPSKIYVLRFDGGSRGNPGTVGAGIVVYDDQGNEIWSGWKYHPEPATNNVAEYLGLLCGLKCVHSFGITQLIAEGDSQLVVKQINREYRVKDANLKKYHKACVAVAEHFDYFEIRHIPRAENSRADWLANHAMDLKESNGCDEDLGIE